MNSKDIDTLVDLIDFNHLRNLLKTSDRELLKLDFSFYFKSILSKHGVKQ